MKKEPLSLVEYALVAIFCIVLYTVAGDRLGARYRGKPAARDDVLQLFDFSLERAQTAQDLAFAQLAIDALAEAVQRQSSRTRFNYRKSGDSRFLRKRIVPANNSGDVALYKIDGASTVTVLAVRHQLEDDYH